MPSGGGIDGLPSRGRSIPRAVLYEDLLCDSEVGSFQFLQNRAKITVAMRLYIQVEMSESAVRYLRDGLSIFLGILHLQKANPTLIFMGKVEYRCLEYRYRLGIDYQQFIVCICLRQPIYPGWQTDSLKYRI